MRPEYSINDENAVNVAENYILPWGKKHKGKRLADIPNDYISWLSTCDNETVSSFADLIRRYRERWNINIQE